LNILKIQAEELTTTNIDRLYKLLDSSKKGFVFKGDFKQILEEGFKGNANESNEGKAWLANAKQQLGLNLSKVFTSLKQSFESPF